MTKDQPGDERLRVLVVDDHALFRRGLEMVLGGEPDLELVGEASDGQEGIEATAQIKDLLPHVKILMLTISDEEADLYDAIKAGASGYLLKEIPIEEVADAIRSVWAGQSRISPSMASKLLTEFAAISKATEERPQMPTPRLTDREWEVLQLGAREHRQALARVEHAGEAAPPLAHGGGRVRRSREDDRDHLIRSGG